MTWADVTGGVPPDTQSDEMFFYWNSFSYFPINFPFFRDKTLFVAVQSNGNNSIIQLFYELSAE